MTEPVLQELPPLKEDEAICLNCYSIYKIRDGAMKYPGPFGAPTVTSDALIFGGQLGCVHCQPERHK